MSPWSLLPLCGALLFTGCAHQPAEPSPEPAAGSEQTDSTPLPPGYDSETLSDLLVAEVAAQRQALGVTLGYYGQAANTTGDPTVRLPTSIIIVAFVIDSRYTRRPP